MSTHLPRLVPRWTLRLAIMTGALGSAACGERTTEPPLPLQSIYVSNQLSTPVNLSSDGRSVGTLGSGRSMDLVVRGLSVDWVRGPFTLPDGRQATDDMMSGRASATVEGAMALISNVVDGATYYAPKVFNTTQRPVTMAILNGGVMRCLTTIPYPENTATRQFNGYWRLTPTSEVRLYESSSCTGSYRSYPASMLQPQHNVTGHVVLDYFAL